MKIGKRQTVRGCVVFILSEIIFFLLAKLKCLPIDRGMHIAYRRVEGLSALLCVFLKENNSSVPARIDPVHASDTNNLLYHT